MIQVFENFTYHRIFYSDDGFNVVLEFSACIDGKALKGIDMICFNQQGKIQQFEVMIRLKSVLDALSERMGQRIAKFSFN